MIPSSFRLGVAATHPIQYHSPWFRALAERLDLEVFYAHRQDSRGQARAGFGVEFDWDTPLLEGYAYRWLDNVARRPTVDAFFGCDTPEIAAIVKRGRFDAFLVFGWNRKSLLQAIGACFRSGVPLLMRGDSLRSARAPVLREALKCVLYPWFLPRISGHLYVGARNREYLEHYGVPAERLFFVPHFVDGGFFEREARDAEEAGRPRAIRRALGIPERAFVLLYAGKMIPKKRPADFIRAFARAARDPGDLHALLVGDGPLRPELEREAAGVPGRVHFAGFRNQREMAGYYRAADAIVLPGAEGETWGLVVNEAAACGIPALVSDAAGCAPDMIDEGRTGFTYPAGDSSALGRRMLALRDLSAAGRAEMRAALAAKAARYSIAEATAGLFRALETVAAPRAATQARRAAGRPGS